MTPNDAHLDEMDEASRAFNAALSRIGAASVAEAILIWRRLGSNRRAQAANAWLNEALLMVGSRRERSRELGLAYYRLVRALRTGRTIPSIYDPEPTVVTLGQLREEFASLVESTDGSQRASARPDAPTPERDTESGPTRRTAPDSDSTGYSPNRPGGDEEIPVDHTDLSVDDIERIFGELDEEEEAKAQSSLTRLGPGRVARDEANLDRDKLSGKEVDEARAETQRKAEAAQAAGAAKYVSNAGRNSVARLSRDDPRCLGFARVGRGDSCYFCQMLISRGPVYFNEKAGAQRASDGEEYHDNCDCYAVPVFRNGDYRRSELHSENRRLEALWKDRIQNKFSTKRAIYEWRRLVEGRTNGRRITRKSR